MLERVNKKYKETTKQCRCGKRFKKEIPRIYGKGEDGSAVVVNYDIICSKHKTIRNVDIY